MVEQYDATIWKISAVNTLNFLCNWMSWVGKFSRVNLWRTESTVHSLLSELARILPSLMEPEVSLVTSLRQTIKRWPVSQLHNINTDNFPFKTEIFSYFVVCYFLSTLNSCFSIYFSWRSLKKAKEITEEPPPVHNKWNMKFNTNMCWNFMYITCQKSTANLKLIDNLVVWPDTSNLSVAISANWLHYRIRKLLDWSSDWLRAISNGIIIIESSHTNFNSYIKI